MRYCSEKEAVAGVVVVGVVVVEVMVLSRGHCLLSHMVGVKTCLNLLLGRFCSGPALMEW